MVEIYSTVKYVNTYKTEKPKNKGKIGCLFKMILNKKKHSPVNLFLGTHKKKMLFLSTYIGRCNMICDKFQTSCPKFCFSTKTYAHYYVYVVQRGLQQVKEHRNQNNK